MLGITKRCTRKGRNRVEGRACPVRTCRVGRHRDFSRAFKSADACVEVTKEVAGTEVEDIDTPTGATATFGLPM